MPISCTIAQVAGLGVGRGVGLDVGGGVGLRVGAAVGGVGAGVATTQVSELEIWGAYFPSGQSRHLMLSSKLEYLPRGHTWQKVALNPPIASKK